MFNSFKFTLYVAVALFVACSFKSDKEENAVVFKKFPFEKKTNEVNHLRISLQSPVGISLYNDSLLLVRNAANSSKYHFSLFNLKSKTFMENYLPLGRKPGEVMSFLSYGLLNDRLWAYDIIKDKIISTNLGNPIVEVDTIASNVPKFYYSIQMLNDKKIIGSGDYDSNYKLDLLDLSTGMVEEQIGVFNMDNQVYSRAKKMEYESFLFLKSSKDKCVTASRYADRIEIFDLISKKSKVIRGPENYNPDVSVMSSNNGMEVIARNSNTRYAFLGGKTTDKYIYLLYSGNVHDSPHLFYGKYIYVYDWEGNPVQKIILKDYVTDFAVTSDNETLYSYNPKTKYIQIVKL